MVRRPFGADNVSAAAFPLSPPCQALGLGFVGTGGLELRGRRGCESLSCLVPHPPTGNVGKKKGQEEGGLGGRDGAGFAAVKNAEAGRRR